MSVRACILRIEGTNCEEETRLALMNAGAKAELVHLKQLECSRDVAKENWRSLFDYRILLIPGGFSAGDSVRAGAILAARMRSVIERDLRRFVEEGGLVGGICNGFQVLVELGLLPAFGQVMSERPEAALFTNANARFECRPVLLKKESRGKCIWTRDVPDEVCLMPVAHGEGRFVVPPGQEEDCIRRLIENDQLVFRYVKEDGSPADGEYPYNPNGSLYDVAAICNMDGNVLGMMPHPERVCDPLNNPDWTRQQRPAAGLAVFQSAVQYGSNAS